MLCMRNYQPQNRKRRNKQLPVCKIQKLNMKCEMEYLEIYVLFQVIYALSDFLIMIVSWLVKQSLRAFLFQEVQP